MDILSLFSVNKIFFTILTYQMSYLEFVGTVLNLASVYLAVKNKVLTWPVGNIAVFLFAVLFFQIQLYSDFFEQIYFLVTGFWGWWIWTNRKNKNKKEMQISYNSKRTNYLCLIVIILGTLGLGLLMSKINIYLPVFFPEPASFPYLDAFTTVMSFTAQILLARKKLDSWYLWILVDIIGIWLYFTKGVVFVSILYAVFLVLAVRGLLDWRKIYAAQEKL